MLCPNYICSTLDKYHVHSDLYSRFSEPAASLHSQLFTFFPLIHCVQKVPGLLLLLNLSDKLAGHELHHPDVLKKQYLEYQLLPHTPCLECP